MSNQQVEQFLQNKRWLNDIIRFGLVGVVATVVDISLLNILFISVRLNIYTAAALAFVSASIIAYWLNNRWTYQRLQLQFQAKNLIRYTIIGAVGLAVTEGIIYVLAVRNGLNYNLAKIIAIAIVFFWNFFGNRFWTFRVKN